MWEFLWRMVSELAVRPKLAQAFVRNSRGTTDPLLTQPRAREPQGASSLALMVLTGSAVVGEGAAFCPQSWRPFGSVTEAILPHGLPGRYSSTGLVWCCGNAARCPSSSCWDGRFWWVLADVPAYLQAPLSRSFHRAVRC